MAQIEKVRVHLQTLTPLHIGGSEGSLSPLQFAHCNGKVYVISPERWADWLRQNNAVENFITYVKEKGKYASLQEYLTSKNRGWFKPEILALLAKYTVESASAPTGDLRPFIRNGYQQPYIPGSAIKGALRTAILFAYLKELKRQALSQFKNLVEEPIRAVLADRTLSLKDKKASLGHQLTPNFFQSFILGGAKKGPHKDLFKTISIADVSMQPFDKNTLIVEEVKVLSLDATQPDGWRYSTGRQSRRERNPGDKRPYPQGGFSLFSECLLPNVPPAQLTVEVRFDVEMFERFREEQRQGNPVMSLRQFILKKAAELFPNQPLDGKALVKTLVTLAEQSAQHWVQEEIAFFSTIENVAPILALYQDPTFRPTLRLGWGAGIKGITMYTLLPNDIQDEIKKIFMILLAPDALRKYPSEFAVFPKTRRVIVRHGLPESVLGWVHLEVL
ncbi:MAG: type III-A CRISPR-associated RAMP protein Csm5 [Candidatus Caldarchaeum sp.]